MHYHAPFVFVLQLIVNENVMRIQKKNQKISFKSKGKIKKELNFFDWLSPRKLSK